MYAWIWRKLPFGLWGRLTGSLVLVTIVGALLWYVVFPWATPLLPFDDVQVGGVDGARHAVDQGARAAELRLDTGTRHAAAVGIRRIHPAFHRAEAQAGARREIQRGHGQHQHHLVAGSEQGAQVARERALVDLRRRRAREFRGDEMLRRHVIVGRRVFRGSRRVHRYARREDHHARRRSDAAPGARDDLRADGAP